MTRTFRMLIDGQLREGVEKLTVHNPATREVVGEAPDCTPAELESAIDAARRAFPAWAALDIAERRHLLNGIADRINEHADELKRLLTAEQGKPHADAEVEVLGSAWYLKGSMHFDLPVTVVEDTPERLVEIRHTPIGVVAGLVPWNFPLVLAIFKLGPALLAGNCLVLKPSPYTPLTTLRLGELVADILPPGVLNIIAGGDRLGPWLTAHPGIDKVSFTGSTATGRKIMAGAAARLQPVTLELGGNDSAIVLPDVDPQAVAEDLFWAAFRNAGQVCIAAKRVYIHAEVYDEVANALVAYSRTVKIGDGAEQGTQIGPLNNEPQYRRVLELIEDARINGQRFLTGGDTDVHAPGSPGYFVPITILDNPPEDSRIVQEEQFGPIMPLMRYHDLDEAVARANDCDYGLGNTIWTSDPEGARPLASRLESGVVWINQALSLTPGMALGGWKQSGIGVEGSQIGLLEFTHTQTMVLNRMSLQRATVQGGA